MRPSDADVKRHANLRARSERILEDARTTALTNGHYDSTETRSKMQQSFRENFQSDAYDWQLDAAEAILLGLNSIVIAGTGTGKTIPFMLPLLLNPSKMLLIISPLKLLQREQVTRFSKIGLNALAVNGDTWSPTLEKKLETHQFQAVITSPEMCLKHPKFRRWLVAEKTSRALLATIIDEAHCITEWGGDFRPAYSSVDKLQTFMPLGIPIYLTSATIPPAALADLYQRFNIDQNQTYLLNLGNERHNITTLVIPIKSSQDYEALYNVLQDPTTLSSFDTLEKTVVFTNVVNTTQIICREVRKYYGAGCISHIDYLHSHRTHRAKQRVMRLFRCGKVRVLIATEAAGMGADISDIELVVQFGVPSSLSVLTQRFGRAGRSRTMSARGVLLAEKSMFKRKKRRTVKHPMRRTRPLSTNTNDGVLSGSDDSGGSVSDDNEITHVSGDDDGKEWGKKVEKYLRRYITTTHCRTAIANKYFDNPPNVRGADSLPLNDETPALVNCGHCDNCLKVQKIDDTPIPSPSQPFIDIDAIGSDTELPLAPQSDKEDSLQTSNDAHNSNKTPPPSTPFSRGSDKSSAPNDQLVSRCVTPENVQQDNDTSMTPSKTPNSKGKRVMVSRQDGPATRRDEHLKRARHTLENWRTRVHYAQYTPSPFLPTSILSNSTLTTLASNARIKSLDDIHSIIKPPWVFAERHGLEVLELLRKVDQAEKQEKAQRALEKREAKKIKTATNRAMAARQKREQQAKARQRQENQKHTPPMINASHGYGPALVGSSTFNSTNVLHTPSSIAQNYSYYSPGFPVMFSPVPATSTTAQTPFIITPPYPPLTPTPVHHHVHDSPAQYTPTLPHDHYLYY